MSPKIVSEVVRSSKQMNLLWSHIRWVTPESPLNPNFEDWAAAAPCSAFSSVPGGALQVCLCFRQQLPPAVLQEKCSCSFSLGALERAVASLYPARRVPWHVWLTWLGGFPAVQVFLWLQATDLAPCARFTYSNSLLCNCTWNRQELSECNLFMLVYILLHHFIADFAFEGSGSRVEVHRHTVLTNSFLERATPLKGQFVSQKLMTQQKELKDGMIRCLDPPLETRGVAEPIPLPCSTFCALVISLKPGLGAVGCNRRLEHPLHPCSGHRSRSSRRDRCPGSLRALRGRLRLSGSKPWRLFTLPQCFPRCADVTQAVA